METNGISKYEQLEKAWAKYIGTKYAVACSSGTTGLHLALAALNIGPGDEVIVPEFTMAATVFAVSYTGATPVFADCDGDLNADLTVVLLRLTSRTKAIIVTHIYGRPVKWLGGLRSLSQLYGVPIIEDACEAHGATISSYLGKRKVGSIGAMGVFSLYKNKIIQSEEGGLITTNSKSLADRMRYLRSMAMEEGYQHREIGYNYRITNMQAEVALQELQDIDKKLELRQEFRKYLDQELEEFIRPRAKGSVIWVYDMIFETKKLRDRIYKKLKKAGIQVRLFFKPTSSLADYRDNTVESLSLDSNATYVSQLGLYVPFTLNYLELDKIIEIIKHETSSSRRR